MALTNEPIDALGNTVGTPDLTGEMRDSKMNSCAKQEPAQSARGQGCDEGRGAEER